MSAERMTPYEMGRAEARRMIAERKKQTGGRVFSREKEERLRILLTDWSVAS